MAFLTHGPVLVWVHRGLDRRWLALYLGAWLTAILLSRVAVPRIGPNPSLESQSLEQLGAAGLCAPVVLLGTLCMDRSTWLTSISPRSHARMRLLALAEVGFLGAVGVVVASQAYPAAVSRLRIAAVLVVVLALTVVSSRFADRVWVGIAGPVVVAVSTVRGVVPWELNVIYNPESDRLLFSIAGVLTVAAYVAVALPSARVDRPE